MSTHLLPGSRLVNLLLLRRSLFQTLGDELISLDEAHKAALVEPSRVLRPGVVLGLPVAKAAVAVKAFHLIA